MDGSHTNHTNHSSNSSHSGRTSSGTGPHPRSRLRPHIVSQCYPHTSGLVVHLCDEIDLHSITMLSAIMRKCRADGTHHLTLHLDEVTFCDSSLLREMARWEKDGGSCVFASASAAVERLYEAAGVPLPAAPPARRHAGEPGDGGGTAVRRADGERCR
ncbi:STAS domain-containing protein [Streptomyces sp. NPDC090106]|uniref:STAS domain-containing protein n=1 Tax=Streptomyces sp. NPDC090106 TaxID=3365946 RepID=UPI0037F82DC6